MSGRRGKKHKEERKPQTKPDSRQFQPQCAEAPQPAKCAPEQTTDGPSEDQQELAAKWIRKPDPFDVALIGLALTFAIAVIYWFQLRSMQDSVRMTAMALEMDQRPWVKVDYGEGAALQLALASPTLQKVTLTNVGKSPLLRLRVHLGVEIVANGTEPRFDWGNYHGESKVAIMLPNVPISVPAQLIDAERAAPHILTPTEYGDLTKGTRLLLTYVRIAYDDTLGIGHWQQPCNWAGFPGVSNMNQTVTHTKCVEYTATDNKKAK